MAVRMATALILLCAAPAAFAQNAPEPTAPPAESGMLVYTPDFFASAQPNNALEMIRRLPGFALDIGNLDARGLAGAAGNVLIDGDRPTSKSDTLDLILARISAASVARIELIRGGAPGIDMQGRAVIANVVLQRTASREIALEANTYAYAAGDITPVLKAQYARRAGDSQTEAALSLSAGRVGGTATGRRTRYDPTGAVAGSTDLRLSSLPRDASLRGTVQRPIGGGKLRVNALAHYTHTSSYQDIAIVSGAGSDDRARDDAHNRSAEIGLNWIGALGRRAELEVTGLQRLDRNSYAATSAAGGTTSAFDSESTGGESVGRAVLRYRPNDLWSIEGGGELAYNFLESATRYAENQVPIALPNAAILVNELRGEVFGQGTWRLNPRLTLEAGLRVELSRIAQSGDTDAAKSFVYPKPRFQLSWLPAAGQQVRLRLESEVGQLDFTDFTASTEINLGTVAGGNANLRPQRSTTLEAVYERRFWRKGSLELTLSHAWLQDVLDTIPLLGGYDATGNIGSGTADTAKASLTLPLDRLGVKDGLLVLGATALHTRVTDPLTGLPRAQADTEAFDCSISYTQDLDQGRLGYGFTHDCNADVYTNYRVGEVRIDRYPPFLSLFVKWKPSPALTLRLDLRNVLDVRASTRRDLYSGFRDSTPLLYRENRALGRGPYAYLQIRKTL